MERGSEYASTGRVLDTTWVPPMSIVRGSVVGSGNKIYRTAIHSQVRNGYLYPQHGICTCPVGNNCKHAAAVLLAFMWEETNFEEADTRAPWERSLLALMGAEEPGSEKTQTRLLGVQLELRPKASPRYYASAVEKINSGEIPHTSKLELTMRPVQLNEKGRWVSGNLTWQHFRYTRSGEVPTLPFDNEYDPLQVEWFCTLLQLNSFAAWNGSHLLTSDFLSPMVWNHLAQAPALGIEFRALVGQVPRHGARRGECPCRRRLRRKETAASAPYRRNSCRFRHRLRRDDFGPRGLLVGQLQHPQERQHPLGALQGTVVPAHHRPAAFGQEDHHSRQRPGKLRAGVPAQNRQGHSRGLLGPLDIGSGLRAPHDGPEAHAPCRRRGTTPEAEEREGRRARREVVLGLRLRGHVRAHGAFARKLRRTGPQGGDVPAPRDRRGLGRLPGGVCRAVPRFETHRGIRGERHRPDRRPGRPVRFAGLAAPPAASLPGNHCGGHRHRVRGTHRRPADHRFGPKHRNQRLVRSGRRGTDRREQGSLHRAFPGAGTQREAPHAAQREVLRARPAGIRTASPAHRGGPFAVRFARRRHRPHFQAPGVPVGRPEGTGDECRSHGGMENLRREPGQHLLRRARPGARGHQRHPPPVPTRGV